MPEWAKLTLKDAGVRVIDCEHRTPVALESGYPYITIPNMHGGRIDPRGARLMSHDDLVSWNRKADPQDHDVVLSRRTNPGETAVAPPGLRFALGQNLVLLRADGSRIHPPFLRWLVRGPAWWEQIGRFLNVGAVFDSLKVADIPNFVLPVPPIDEQRRVAGILGALDDKIELGRQMGETLEAMARALFRGWFGEQRQAGVEDPVGDVMMGTLLDVAALISGGTPKTDRTEYWNGDIPWASAKDVSQCRGPFLIETERTITPSGLAGSPTKMIPALATVVVARGATTGRLAMLGEAMAMNQTCYALASRDGTPRWLYLQLEHSMASLVQSAHGSVFDTITTTTFARTSLVLPSLAARRAFEERVGPLFDRVLACAHEARTLTAQRDALLPRLLSGGPTVGAAG